MEQVRIVKEMRERDRRSGGYFSRHPRPRYMVWENVCFDADTLVACENGYTRIADVSVGTKVKTLSGRYMPVAKVHKTLRQEVLKLSVSDGEDLYVTPNHPFYVREKTYPHGLTRQISEPKWMRAEDLTDKCLIAYRTDVPTLPDDFISESEAYAVGRWLADGSVDLKKSTPRIFISCGLKKAEATYMELSKLPYEIYQNRAHATAVNFCFTSHEFYSLIRDAGVGAGNKEVPPYVFELPIKLQTAVLNGYTSGDGHIRTRGNCTEFTASTASRKLAYGIARLVRNVHRTIANISAIPPKNGLISGRILHANHPSYRVTATLTGNYTTGYDDGEFIWQPVKQIERVDGKRTVYNLSVYEDNTYGANDVVVHNCGAFSSNKGADFQAVLTEIVRIVEPEADDVPMPEKNKWPHSGCLYDEMGRWSIAWRVHDAQFWGVPQRRKRIALVADFGGLSGPEVLFERKGLCGDFKESGTQGEGASEASGNSTQDPGGPGTISFQERAGKPGGGKGILIQNERVGTLSTLNNQSVFTVYNGESVTSPANKSSPKPGDPCHTLTTDSRNYLIEDEPAGYGETGIGYWKQGIQTLRAEGENRPSRPSNVVVENGEPDKCLNPWDVQSKHIQPENGIAEALYAGECRYSGGESYVLQEKTMCYDMDNERRRGPDEFKEQSPTLTSRAGTGGNNVPCVTNVRADGACGNKEVICMATQQGGAEIRTDDGAPTLTAAAGMSGNNQPVICIQGNVIDRADTANCNGKGWKEDVSFALNTVDRPAVAYGFEPGAAQRLNPESRFSEECSPTLRADMGDNQVAVAFSQNQREEARELGDVSGSITAEAGMHQQTFVCEGEQPIPINTMVGTRTTEEKRTTFGVGSPGDPQFTLSAAHSHAVFNPSEKVMVLNDQGGSVMSVSEDVTGTLRAEEHGHQPVITMNPRPQSMVCGEDVAATLGAADYKEPQMVFDARGNGDGKTVPTLTGDHQDRVTDYTAICLEGADKGVHEVTGPLMASGYSKNGTQEAANGMYVIGNSAHGFSMQGFGDYKESDKASACKARDYKDATDLVAVTGTLEAVDYKGPNAQYVRKGMLQLTHNTVRRLTPLECERLQGYPDHWTLIGEPEEIEVKDYEQTYDEEGNVTGKTCVGTHKETAYFYTGSDGKKKKVTDSARYKALGNSIALPFWFYLLRRISAQYERPATLGSLFDGIGGFPLSWERCNGQGTALWASEIEEFPIAVTKVHFPE